MAISMQCGCGKVLHVPEEHIGRKVRCKKCGSTLKVPKGSTYDPSRDPELAPPQHVSPATPQVPDQPFDPFAEPTGPQRSHFSCTRCGAAMTPEAVLCTNCGYSMKTGRRLSSVVKDGKDPGEERVVFSAFGEDFTVGKTIGLAALLALITIGVVWWVTGPGARAQILAVQPVDAVLAMHGVSKQRGGGVTMIGGAMSIGPSGSTDDPGVPFTLGHGESLYVVRPDADGDHLIVHVAVSQRMMVDKKMAQDNHVRILAPQFKLNNADGTGTPVHATLLYQAFDGRAYVDLYSSEVPRHVAMLPPNVEPAQTDVKRLQGGVLQGTVLYDGTGGVDGALSFEKLIDTSLIGPTGISAEGKLVRRHRALTVDYNYAGDTLEIVWSDGSIGWWAKASDRRSEKLAPTAKYEALLLFERPSDSGMDTLWFDDEVIGRLPRGVTPIEHDVVRAPDPDAMPDTATAEPRRRTADPTGMGAYFHLLADAKRQATSITSVSNMRQIGLAIMMYTNDHGGQLPDTLQDVRPFLDRAGAVLENHRTGDRPGYIYVKPDEATGQQHPARTPILYESRGGVRDPGGAVLYLDGHVEIGGVR